MSQNDTAAIPTHLNFRIKKVEIPVQLEDDDGKVRNFVLRKANGAAIASLRNSLMMNAKIVKNKVTEVNNMADGEPVLVAACLKELVKNHQGIVVEQPVTVEYVRSLDYTIIDSMFNTIVKISDLGNLFGNKESNEDKIKRLNTELAEAMQEKADEEERKNS